MGLMRRVELSLEGAMGSSRQPAPERSPQRRTNRKTNLRVQPKELGQKLIKEMEDHKVVQQDVTEVDHQFGVYLCPDDFDSYADRLDDLTDRLERALQKHARSRKYRLRGDIEVHIFREPDLRPGYFGIRAGDIPVPAMAPRSSFVEPCSTVPEVASGVSRVGATAASEGVHELPVRGTVIIPPAQAAQLGLVSQVVVLRSGNGAREFSQGRVVLGRAREADFRVDDPNVSRRHALIFWADGQLFLEDLGSTNGTHVNGQLVSRSVLRSGDVITMGDFRVIVETKSG